MKARDARLMRAFGWAAMLAAALQLFGFCRYLDRVEGDWIGIALYIVAIVAFVVIAVGCFVQARAES